MPVKKRFDMTPFPKTPSGAPPVVDVYARGVKVLRGHDGTRDNVYLWVGDDVKPEEVEYRPHDPRCLECAEVNPKTGLFDLSEKSEPVVPKKKGPKKNSFPDTENHGV